MECISSKFGLLHITTDKDYPTIEKVSTTIAGLTIQPNEKTDLLGFFNCEVEYIGLIDGWMAFDIGSTVDLFEKKTYFNLFKQIDDNSMVTVYQAGTARDYCYRNGKWK
jgi:hypothetical protein